MQALFIFCQIGHHEFEFRILKDNDIEVIYHEIRQNVINDYGLSVKLQKINC